MGLKDGLERKSAEGWTNEQRNMQKGVDPCWNVLLRGQNDERNPLSFYLFCHGITQAARAGHICNPHLLIYTLSWAPRSYKSPCCGDPWSKALHSFINIHLRPDCRPAHYTLRSAPEPCWLWNIKQDRLSLSRMIWCVYINIYIYIFIYIQSI